MAKDRIGLMAVSMKHALFFFILFLCFAFAPGGADAWLVTPQVSPAPHADEPRKIDGLNTCFAMFDNPSSRPARGNNPCLISCDEHNFAAIIHLNAKIPLKLLAKRDISPKESLDALLYADLQMRQLMQELAQLKKRTAMVLKDLSIPYLDKTLLKKPGSSGTLKEEKDSLERKKRAITVLTGHDLKAGKILSFNKESFIRKKFISPYPIEKSSSQEINDKLDKGERGFTNISQTDELPRIFKVLYVFFHYIMTNRFESIFYLTILFMIFYFISLKIKYRQ